jgi:hypothetical protein
MNPSVAVIIVIGGAIVRCGASEEQPKVTSGAVSAISGNAVDVYGVYWSSDTSNRDSIEKAMTGFVQESTFKTWVNQWNISTVTYHGSWVLTSAPPGTLKLGPGNTVEKTLNLAFDGGALPKPSAFSVYIVRGPSAHPGDNVDQHGGWICTLSGNECGVHDLHSYGGTNYQAGLVPLHCPEIFANNQDGGNLGCSGDLETSTWIGAHEMAEGAVRIADRSTLCEVGDNQCELNGPTLSLNYCGTNYAFQTLRSNSGNACGQCEGFSTTGSCGGTCNSGYTVQGGILGKFNALRGCSGLLGAPTTNENPTPDGIGRYNHFAGSGGGSIYWTPSTGAWSVHGAIRQKWAALGWEKSFLGYPVSDEQGSSSGVTGSTARFNDFRKNGGSGSDGSVYWSSGTGAWSVHGAIRQAWLNAGGAPSSLGLPISDEYSANGGIQEDFECATILWKNNTATIFQTCRG